MVRGAQHRWLILLWRLASSVLIITLIAEAGLRVAGLGHSYESEADTYQTSSNSDLVFTLRPGYRGYSEGTEVSISSQGLRDREYAPGRQASTARLLMLGDSVTFGVGVLAEETFSKQLEQLLNAASQDRRFEAINAGIPGYNTVQERARLQEIGAHVQPDLVVLTFVVNDLLDSFSIFNQAYNPTGPLAPAKQWLRRNVRLVRFYQNISWRAAEAARRENAPDEPVRRRERVLERFAEINRIARISAEQGARFALVLYPDNLSQFVTPGSDGQRLTVREELLRFANEQGYPVLDLTEAVGDVRDQRARTMRLKEDPHPSPTGHRAIAEALFRFLTSADLLPSESSNGSAPRP
jgi:lysophospholipase L1-like esterase